MAKFKVGDRVKMRLDGAEGTVFKVDDDVWVNLDNGYSNPRHWTEAGATVCLFHIGGAPVTVAEAIDAYQQACTDFEAAQLAVEKAKAAVQDARLNLRDALDGET